MVQYEQETVQESSSYRRDLLRLWLETISVGLLVRKMQAIDSPNKDLLSKYVALLCTMWHELQPKVAGEARVKEYKQEFERFKDMAYDPQQLMMPTNIRKVHELASLLRNILHKLELLPLDRD